MTIYLLLLLLFGVVDAVVCGRTDGFSVLNKVEFLTITLSLLAASAPCDLGISEPPKLTQRRSAHNNRTRRPINSMFKEQGPIYVRRAYRMHSRSFWTLLSSLCPHLKEQPREAKRGAKNGFTSHATRLSVALRYFAGGRTDDIALVHGISHTAVYQSVWQIVDAVNKCNEKLGIQHPTDHDEQRKIAQGFKRRSRTGFDICDGAIDCMLVWIDKPTVRECDKSEVGPRKFFCGRKHKCGVNLQAVCDSEGRFLDVSIGHPASTADWLCFKTSSLYKKLESGLLAGGLVLFGDNVYVNNAHMAVPWRNTRGSDKDNYNF